MVRIRLQCTVLPHVFTQTVHLLLLQCLWFLATDLNNVTVTIRNDYAKISGKFGREQYMI